MIRKNFDIALAKGELGEAIVRKLLEDKGFIVYKPNTEGAHAFDALAIKDKKLCIAMDVKAKSRRNKFNDTGINENHYVVYKQFSDRHNMPFWVIFVDEMQGKIYGNTLDKLDQRVVDGNLIYPWVSNGVRYWHLSVMKPIHDLDENQKRALVGMSQRNYEYQK